MQCQDPASPRPACPSGWQLYLDHACQGLSLRELARREGMHPSTVLRRVRRMEELRDDPLVDAALSRLEAAPLPQSPLQKDQTEMSMHPRAEDFPNDTNRLMHEGARVLRRLAEPGAQLAVAPDMEKAVVLRRFPDGRQLRTAVLETVLAQAFVLRDWISCRATGRVALYELTAAGRAALRRHLAATDPLEAAGEGLAEAASPFAAQHRDWGERVVPDAEAEGGAKRLRVNLSESPVTLLGRRRDKDGQPFLTPTQVAAAERLREDFELAQMGPRVGQNWDRFLTGGVRGDFGGADRGQSSSALSARDRVAAALRDLGPGLGDMVLRCCCYLEGIEAAEKRLGWSARSGKVVLRIALDRLTRHYDDLSGPGDRRIG